MVAGLPEGSSTAWMSHGSIPATCISLPADLRDRRPSGEDRPRTASSSLLPRAEEIGTADLLDSLRPEAAAQLPEIGNAVSLILHAGHPAPRARPGYGV